MSATLESRTTQGLAAGAVVGRYVLLERLGAGGFGEVWKARLAGEDAGTCPPFVALKVATSARAIDALRREGAIQSRLDHPGIVKVLDRGLGEEPAWIAFEYCPGGSLRAFLAALPADEPRRPIVLRGVFREIAGALACAHEAGVAHGDLKPENVVFDAERRPKITDFGLGTTAAGGALELSRSLASVELGGGTLAYLAPERHTGARPSAAGDVWAFGVMLFEATFGRLPQGIEGTEWPLGPLFARCYAPVGRRMADARAIVEALDAPPPAPPPPPTFGLRSAETFHAPRPLSRPPRRGRLSWGIAVVSIVGVLAGIAGIASDGPRSRYPSGPRTPPPMPAAAEVERGCLTVFAALAELPGGRATREQWSVARRIDGAREEARRRGYYIVPEPGNVRALPCEAGWPAYVLDARGFRRQQQP